MTSTSTGSDTGSGGSGPRPKRLGKYVLTEALARGSMGRVYRARAFGPGGVAKDLCVKRVRARRLEQSGALERFVAEARVAMRLAHANIVPIFDFGRAEGEYFLAMEWVDGVDVALLLDDAHATFESASSTRRGARRGGGRTRARLRAHVAGLVRRASRHQAGQRLGLAGGGRAAHRFRHLGGGRRDGWGRGHPVVCRARAVGRWRDRPESRSACARHDAPRAADRAPAGAGGRARAVGGDPSRARRARDGHDGARTGGAALERKTGRRRARGVRRARESHGPSRTARRARVPCRRRYLDTNARPSLAPRRSGDREST